MASRRRSTARKSGKRRRSTRNPSWHRAVKRYTDWRKGRARKLTERERMAKDRRQAKADIAKAKGERRVRKDQERIEKDQRKAARRQYVRDQMEAAERRLEERKAAGRPVIQMAPVAVRDAQTGPAAAQPGAVPCGAPTEDGTPCERETKHGDCGIPAHRGHARSRVTGLALSDADRRRWALRESGYRGWIDQDGHAVADVDEWIKGQVRRGIDERGRRARR